MWALVILFLVTPDTTKSGVAIHRYDTQAECIKNMVPPEDISEMSRGFNGEGSPFGKNVVDIEQFCIPTEAVILDEYSLPEKAIPDDPRSQDHAPRG